MKITRTVGLAALMLTMALVAPPALAQSGPPPSDDELRERAYRDIERGRLLDYRRKSLRDLVKRSRRAEKARDYYYIGLSFQKQGEGLKAIGNYELARKTRGASAETKRLAAKRIAELQGKDKAVPFKSLGLVDTKKLQEEARKKKAEEARKKKAEEERKKREAKKRIIESYLELSSDDEAAKKRAVTAQRWPDSG